MPKTKVNWIISQLWLDSWEVCSATSFCKRSRCWGVNSRNEETRSKCLSVVSFTSSPSYAFYLGHSSKKTYSCVSYPTNHQNPELTQARSQLSSRTTSSLMSLRCSKGCVSTLLWNYLLSLQFVTLWKKPLKSMANSALTLQNKVRKT